MSSFERQNSILPQEDLSDGVQLIQNISEKLEKSESKLAGGMSETSTARKIRDEIFALTGEFARLEAFRTNRLLGRGAFPYFGICYFVSLLLYFISFAGGRISGILLTLFALATFVFSVVTSTLMLLGKDKLFYKTKNKVSYNVVSEKVSEKVTASENMTTVIIADNHDGVMGRFFSSYGVWHKIALIALPCSAILFVLFCIIKMAVGSDTVTAIVVLTVLPFVCSVSGIIATAAYYSPFEKKALPNNGVATAMALATYKYFVDNSEILPDNTKLVYVSLGSENNAKLGSEAFIKAHPEYKNARVLGFGDMQSGNAFVINENPIKHLSYSVSMREAVEKSAQSQNIELQNYNIADLSQKSECFYGYISDNFTKIGIKSVTICAKDNNPDTVSSISKEDMEKIFSLCVGTVNNCFSDLRHAQQ